VLNWLDELKTKVPVRQVFGSGFGNQDSGGGENAAKRFGLPDHLVTRSRVNVVLGEEPIDLVSGRSTTLRSHAARADFASRRG
jgi:hypothetical protein